MGSDGIETSIEALAARVQVLERDVGVMKGILWHSAGAAPDSPPPAAPQPAPPQPVAPNGWAPPSAPSWGPARAPAWAPAAPGPAAPSLALRDEAKLAGAWFARAGALAVLVGAGFAFKYGIDRGLITEPVRVLVGLLAGLAFVAWGYWARRKGWATFSQAVTAGGIAICYLSVTVANLAYHLISGPVTFGSLVAITAGSAALAYWYDSLALAILATVGGFLTPFLAWQGGKPQGAALYTYVAILDAGVLGLAFFKAWRPLDAVARAGTSILFGVGLSSVGFGVAMGFATAFLLLFVAVPVLANLAPARRDGETSDEADGVLLVASTLAYYGFGMFLLWHHDHADLRGAFTFGLAGAFAGLASLAAVVAPRDRMLRLFLWALSVAAITTAIPLQFHQFAVALGWAGEGLGLTWAGMRARSVTLRTVGAAILGGGGMVAFGRLFDHYTPPHLLVSPASATVLAVIAALGFEAFLFSRDADPESRRLWYPWSAVAANGLAVAWLSAEALAYYHPGLGGLRWQPLQFTLSAIWAIYAGILLGVGVASRQRWARLAALGLFTVTVAKMLVIDLWTLSTGERVLAFIGLGGLLLACSLVYHRFKHLILGDEGEQGSWGASASLTFEPK
ncbi:MAG TPA: DUF2339 domain-containing protein [Actinomycetota bacterium]|nr:DUF2339 domain-containing protein [Actinomycetota bacterium]